MLLPKIKVFLDQVNVLNKSRQLAGFKYNQTNVREGMAYLPFSYMTEANQQIKIIDDTILNDKYPVPIRIYMPPESKNLPIMLYFHGGGHVSGSISIYDKVVRKITKLTNHIVVSVDYRLSPEFAYPVAINDCKKAIANVFSVLDEWNIKYCNRNLTLMGDSAGGALSASIIMDAEFVCRYKIKKQVLIYPSLDYTMSTDSVDKYATGYLLERAKKEWYFKNYLQNNEDRKTVSPLHSNVYVSMPKTLVIVAQYDPLHDEGVLYHEKLKSIGVETKLIEVDGVLHGFFLLEDLCKEECNTTYAKINAFLDT